MGVHDSRELEYHTSGRAKHRSLVDENITARKTLSHGLKRRAVEHTEAKNISCLTRFGDIQREGERLAADYYVRRSTIRPGVTVLVNASSRALLDRGY